MENLYRIGYNLIISIIPENSRVLDLGCGDGLLLERLEKEKKIKGFGVEISEDGLSKCVERGLYCYQADIDEGLKDYKSNSYDFVIINQTIQNTKRPDFVIEEVLRIGKKAIVSFPNFGYINTRLQLLFKGKMPKNKLFPYEWYESPNIHLQTIKDFNEFCRKRGYPIKTASHFSMNENSKITQKNFMANLFAQYGFYVLDGKNVI